MTSSVDYLLASQWRPSSAQIAVRRAVADRFGITEAQLLGRSRKQRVCRTRQACALVYERRWPRLGSVKIAVLLARQCHSTVLHALRVAREIERLDPDFAAIVAQVALAPNRALHRRQVHTFSRPGRDEPACARLLETIPIEDTAVLRPHQMFSSEESGPRMSLDEIARRVDAVRAERARRQAALLAAERERYGRTRQTLALPLSEQVI